MNGWIYAKGGPTTMGYLNRSDLPFHYALADAYTIGDDYHCSVISATGPNRLYLMSGTIKPGVPDPSNPLYANGIANVTTDTGVETQNADNIAAAIKADVLSGNLPQVSYVVGNQFFSEHPVTAPSNGAYFLNAVLQALNADPEVFNSTLVIVSYDENDGQFDHVPPPVPAPGEADEFISGTDLTEYGLTAPAPVGLGFRVPLILVSPWTRGGWVTSETADHTSVIQFLEKWTTALGSPRSARTSAPGGARWPAT